MEEFTPLGAEMARLAGRLGTVDPAVGDRTQLEWMVRTGRRLEAFGSAQVALATVHLERLIRNEFAESLRNQPDDAKDASADAADREPDADGASPSGDEANASANDATTPAGGATTGGDGTGTGTGTGTGDGDDDEGDRRESAEELAQRLRRAKWLRRCPLFAAASQAGKISAEHVDMLAVTMEGVEPAVMADVLADEDRLLEAARRMARRAFGGYLRDVIDRVRADGGMARFERQLKNSFASFKPDDATQMYRLFCQIDPVRGAAMYQAVQRRVDEMYQTKGATDGLSKGQVVLQALHDLVCREPVAASDDNEDDADVGGCPEIVVICDCQTLVSGEHAHTICETKEGLRLPVSFVRDMCAEAMLTVAIAGADGTILSVGTAERLANRQQRRALRSMYRHCAHPGCTVPFAHCRIHHVLPWERKGPTDLANLLPLCFKHHHLVHEGMWRLTIDPDRTLHWRRPDGGPHADVAFVPLLTPKAQRSATTRGSPPGATPAASSPPGPDPPPVASPATPTDDLRLFDPSAA